MAQVSEADASGAIADVFADYRAITGFAQTPLILRELASHGAAVCIPAWNAIRALYEPQSFGCVPSVLTAGLRLPRFLSIQPLCDLTLSASRGKAGMDLLAPASRWVDSEQRSNSSPPRTP